VKIYKILLTTILAAGLVCGGAAAEVTDRIVAVVNDDVITLSELNRAFEPYAANIPANFQGTDKETILKQNKTALLQRMIDQILIEQEAKKQAWGRPPLPTRK